MPIGTFLDTFPPSLFIVIHIILLLIGVWAARKAAAGQLRYARAFWLYVLVHLGFLASFAGFFTLKMSVALEQILILVMVLWIVTKATDHQS